MSGWGPGGKQQDVHESDPRGGRGSDSSEHWAVSRCLLPGRDFSRTAWSSLGLWENTLLGGFWLSLPTSRLSHTLGVYTCAYITRRNSVDELARLATYKDRMRLGRVAVIGCGYGNEARTAE